MMKRMIFAAALAVLTGQLEARMCDFYGDLEALYWKPASCPIPFTRAEQDNVNPDTHRTFAIQPDADWGVRALVGASRDCLFTDLAYHWVETNDESRESSGTFTDFHLPGGSTDLTAVRAKLATRYQGIDWRIGYRVQLGAATLGFFGDIRWTDLRFAFDARGPTGAGAIHTYSMISEYDAGGIGAGLEGRFPIWCGLSFGTRLSVTALIGDSKVPLQRAQNAVDAEVAFPRSNTTLHPLLDVRFELSYARCICRWMVNAKVGYELDYIVQGLEYWTTITGDQNTGSPDFPITGCNDFGYGGIYFGLGVEF